MLFTLLHYILLFYIPFVKSMLLTLPPISYVVYPASVNPPFDKLMLLFSLSIILLEKVFKKIQDWRGRGINKNEPQPPQFPRI